MCCDTAFKSETFMLLLCEESVKMLEVYPFLLQQRGGLGNQFLLSKNFVKRSFSARFEMGNVLKLVRRKAGNRNRNRDRFRVAAANSVFYESTSLHKVLSSTSLPDLSQEQKHPIRTQTMILISSIFPLLRLVVLNVRIGLSDMSRRDSERNWPLMSGDPTFQKITTKVEHNSNTR